MEDVQERILARRAKQVRREERGGERGERRETEAERGRERDRDRERQIYLYVVRDEESTLKVC